MSPCRCSAARAEQQWRHWQEPA